MPSNTETEKQTLKAVRQAIWNAIADGELGIIDLETPRVMDDFIKRETRKALDIIHVSHPKDKKGTSHVEQEEASKDDEEQLSEVYSSLLSVLQKPKTDLSE